jgi:hypothetical protein
MRKLKYFETFALALQMNPHSHLSPSEKEMQCVQAANDT